jgi:hypothetical protein
VVDEDVVVDVVEVVVVEVVDLEVVDLEVVVVDVVVEGGGLLVWLNPNIVNLFGPPQISAELPEQAISHSAFPSDAGPPPLRSALSQ